MKCKVVCNVKHYKSRLYFIIEHSINCKIMSEVVFVQSPPPNVYNMTMNFGQKNYLQPVRGHKPWVGMANFARKLFSSETSANFGLKNRV